MNETLRFLISNLLAYPVAAWVGTASWHFLDPPKDAWWNFPCGLTIGLFALGAGFFTGYGFYHATGDDKHK
jgi:hypothetical protein